MPESNTVTGKVIKILPAQSGTSKAGKEWTKQDFVIETSGDYPKKICFTRWGENVQAKVGDELTVSFDPESREYNDKWYTDLKAWKIEGGSDPGVTADDVKDKFDAVLDAEDPSLPF